MPDFSHRCRPVARGAALLAAALTLAGCRFDTILMNNRQSWLWLALPVLAFGLPGAILVFYRRRHQLAFWDLRVSPDEPSSHGIVLGTMAIAGGIFVLFAVYNLFFISMKLNQQLVNVAFWLAGTIIGSGLALFAGLRSAERT
ncbi:MAG TPA: hypothetical protein VHQ90_00540 [Thermoanaerobaculia bacterium]|nr:hypothetical protein [Thermoanaerobaculia bacterium]